MTTRELAEFFRPPSKENAARVHLITIFVAVALSVLLFIAYRTVYSPEPIRQTDVSVMAARDPETGAIRVLETRRFEGLAEETIGVLRTVYAPGVVPAQVVLEGGLFTAQMGEFTTHNTTELPTGIHGLWCLRTAYNWWPSWSQREFAMTVPDVCFYGVHP
jgi:hypothetical protein